MAKLLYSAALLSSAFLSANAYPSELVAREILAPLPENADAIELRFQPYLDFDSNGCYQTAAINGAGKLNAGKQLGGTPEGQCRDAVQLDNSNTYSRRRCNNGICGIVYEYYYEKDQTATGVTCPGTDWCGHKHDFENVVVFARMSDNKILRVSASKHKGYDSRNEGFPVADGTHPLIVYHKDGVSTHCHRFANDDDIAKPENPKGRFWRAPLVGWLGWPNEGLRTAMNDGNWGGPTPKTKEALFAEYLEKAGATSVGLNPKGPDDFLL